MADRNITVKRFRTDVGWENIYPKTTIAQVIDLSTNLANMQGEIDNKTPKHTITPKNGAVKVNYNSFGLITGSSLLSPSDLPSHSHDYVPLSRTVNNKALSSNITLDAADVGAVPTARTVNNKALSSNITLDAADVGARPVGWTPTWSQVSGKPSGLLQKVSFSGGKLVLGAV